MRYVLGTAPAYDERLATLIGFFVTARVLRNDLVLGTFAGPVLGGVALVTLPDTSEPPGALEAARAETWRRLGSDARARYEACGRAWQTVGVEEPNLHLNMLGVRRGLQGRGTSRLLLEAVHEASRGRAGSQGVSLTTEDPGNVPLYRHFGYRIVGRARIAPELETWGFFRAD